MAQSGCRSAADGAKRLSVVDDDAERLVEAEQPRKCAVARTDSPHVEQRPRTYSPSRISGTKGSVATASCEDFDHLELRTHQVHPSE